MDQSNDWAEEEETIGSEYETPPQRKSRGCCCILPAVVPLVLILAIRFVL